MPDEITRKQLRSFGLLVGGGFALIGMWPLLIYRAGPRWWAVTLAVLLLIPALVLPGSLTWVYKRWMALGHIMSWVNTRIILGLIFYAVVTPIGLVRRSLGKDPMGKKTRPDLNSYRIIRKPRPATHLKRQY